MFLHDITFHILTSLSQITGTTSLKNPADLPIIFKNIENYTSVNKALYSIRANPEWTTSLLRIIGARFNSSHEEIAAQWNSKWTREWLWNQFVKAGFQKQHQNIKEIFDLAK